MTTKQINIKNKAYYFYNDLINIKNFDPNMLKIDKKTVLNHSVSYIDYVTKNSEYGIDSVNPLYLMRIKVCLIIILKNGISSETMPGVN